ncbi:MAG: hypothetical protein VKO39_01465, partial [Cyanobacteriota bacterium]|nr:hypothetical protein [Cyanobacteriota bacterium]
MGNNQTLGASASSGNIYVATEGELSLSTNGGLSFINQTSANTSGGLGSNPVRGEYATGSSVYAATNNVTSGVVSISTNSGSTFAKKNVANKLPGKKSSLPSMPAA